MDLSKLSDGDLKALSTGNLSSVSNDGLKYMSGAVDAKPAPEAPSGFAQGAGNLLAGAVRGAGSIGSTLLYPIDKITDVVKGDRQTGPSRNEERRAMIDEGLRAMGAQPESMLYQGGKIAGEIAGTAGAGGVLAKGVQAVSQAPRALQLAEALRTSGMAAGGAGMGTRIAGGAVAGAAQAGMIDPPSVGAGAAIGAALPAASKLIPMAGNGIANLIGGLGTHTGAESIKTAARAGMAGGKEAADFAGNMHGKIPMQDVLDTAKANLETMGQAKSAAYRQGMAKVSGDKTVLDFGGIDKALDYASNVVKFKGQVKNAKAAEIQQKIADEIINWKKLNPNEFHTPEGLDALKQKIGGIVEGIPFEEKTARMIGSNIYNSVKAEITKQAPVYSKTMKGYEEASQQIKEIERVLVGNQKTSVDTAMRKLQSLMRNNVNTNYGNRLDLAKKLQEQGGRDILPALAGQSLNSWTPRGLGGLVATGGAGAAIATGNLPLLALLSTQSPRMMGEAAFATGKLADLMSNKKALEALYKSAPALAAGKN